MNTVKPVVFTTPDGVERVLRSTEGARKRIVDRFGMSMQDALNKYDTGAFPEILYAMMHDAKGQPPADITVEELGESLSTEDGPEIMAVILSASLNGRKTKNELEPLIRQGLKNQLMDGSTPGASVQAPSDSPMSSTGGDTSAAKLPLESSATTKVNGAPISDLPDLKPHSTT